MGGIFYHCERSVTAGGTAVNQEGLIYLYYKIMRNLVQPELTQKLKKATNG